MPTRAAESPRARRVKMKPEVQALLAKIHKTEPVYVGDVAPVAKAGVIKFDNPIKSSRQPRAFSLGHLSVYDQRLTVFEFLICLAIYQTTKITINIPIAVSKACIFSRINSQFSPILTPAKAKAVLQIKAPAKV